ncbi:MAG: transposase [Candidatus Cloacimonadota bacterium]|nr:MAG: transposase [Candidatus Cloacimonadota bacterium]
MESIRIKLRKHLNADSLIKTIRGCFEKIEDKTKKRINKSYPIADALMSAFAIFSLKCPSLVEFEDHLINEHNLKNIYKINTVISDTHMRRVLDEVDPKLFSSAFKKVFAQVQRGGELKKMQVLDKYYLLSIDGTGYFSSKKIHGNCCLEKKSKKTGDITYYHQMLGAVLVHPDEKIVLPMLPEPIMKQDGDTKNDCERNAAKRLLHQIRKDHSHLPLIVIEDGLASNAPHIKELEFNNFRYILGAKKGGHSFLFHFVDQKVIEGKVSKLEMSDDKNTIHKFRYINNVPINESNSDVLVNFIEYWETKSNGKKQHFSWVTDFELSDDNIYEIMRCGRARWRIENETFNTLKNQGYHFEHNFGHGNKNLSVVFAFSMMLCFLVDQVQQMSCDLFGKVLEISKRKKSFWRFIEGCFKFKDCDSMSFLYMWILKRKSIEVFLINDS